MADLMDVFVKIGADTSGLESGIGKAKGIASGLGGAVSTGMKVVGAAIGTATAAVGAFTASSIEVGKTFDSSMSQVAATMGVTTDEIGELRDFAMEMGSTTAFSATQAADALNYMALAGYSADESMQMLPNVLNLAAAGDMELARASDMVTDAQTALGLSFNETTELVDMMAKTSSKTNTSVTQLGDAILTIGGTAKNLAGGTTELNQMLGVLADNGIKGAEGGTHLRNAILSLSAPTDNAAAALEDLGIVTTDFEGNLKPMPELMGEFQTALDGLGTAERADIISTIFNKTDIAAVNALIDTSAERYNELETEINGAWMSEKSFLDELKGSGLENAQKKLESLGLTAEDFEFAAKNSRGSAKEFVDTLAELSDTDSMVVLSTMQTNLSDLQRTFDSVSGSAEQMAQTQLDNLAGDVTMFKSALEGCQLLISGALSESLRDFVKFGTEGLSKISEGFKEGGLEGAMDAFSEVLSDGIKMVVKFIPEAIDAGIQLLDAFATGVIENAPVIFDALVEIGSMIGDKMLELMQGAADATKDFDYANAVQQIIDFIGNAFTEGGAGKFLSLGLEITKNLIDGIIQAIPTLVSAFGNIMTELGNGLRTGLPALVEAGMETLKGLSEAIMNNAPTLLQAGIDLIMALADGLLNALPSLIATVPQIIANLLSALITAAPQLLAAGVELIVKLTTGLVQAIPSLIAEFPKMFQQIIQSFNSVDWRGLGSKLINTIVEGIKALYSAIPEIMKAIATAAVAIVKNTDWAGVGRNIIEFIGSGIKALITALPDIIKTICESMIKTVTSVDWLGVGADMVRGIVEGCKSMADALINVMVELAKSAWTAVKKFFGIESPSKLMRDTIGKNVAIGMAVGIEDELPAVEEAMGELSDIIETPDMTANVSMVGDVSSIGGSSYEDRGELIINDMADAFVKALERYGLMVEIDRRELGRVVRKEVLA